MEPDDNDEPQDLQRRWAERLAKWLRRPETEAREEPTTAATATMRENLDEPRE